MHGCVLVVEDEPLIRRDTVMMLEEAGLTVVAFDDGAEAAAYVRAHASHIAAIFADVFLKGEMDGMALIDVVADVAPQARLLVTSGRFSDRPPNLPPAVRFLKKPWLPLDVLSALQDAVAAY